MGIGFVARGNNIYDGSAVVAEGKVVENGMFVAMEVAEAGNTVTPTAASPEAVPMFVSCVDDTVDEQAINTEDVKFEAGDLIRCKRVLPGEVVVTSVFDGDPAVGATVTAGADGKLVAGTGKQDFKVTMKDTHAGVPVLYTEALN